MTGIKIFVKVVLAAMLLAVITSERVVFTPQIKHAENNMREYSSVYKNWEDKVIKLTKENHVRQTRK